ncbi:MAG: 16S rRNA (guanine(966)-N(2))-methyltransferase RsmD [Eubacteriales bacterium]|nr:16S rRNA (guanine(966)-N(2))-methyltransferase RsmD [Eubacteriales bacterium]
MRIIAGKYKGKVLRTFEADNIRPTSDMVKEAICSKLQFYFPESVVLDLFGGTGNFGFEALSRGADNVYICDNNDKSIAIINLNQQLLKSNANIMQGDYNKCIKNLSNKGISFDIIFLDPPYATTYGEQAMQSILKHKIIKNDGILIFEHSKGKTFDYSGYDLVDKKSYGIKEVSYLKVHND